MSHSSSRATEAVWTTDLGDGQLRRLGDSPKGRPCTRCKDTTDKTGTTGTHILSDSRLRDNLPGRLLRGRDSSRAARRRATRTRRENYGVSVVSGSRRGTAEIRLPNLESRLRWFPAGPRFFLLPRFFLVPQVPLKVFGCLWSALAPFRAAE